MSKYSESRIKLLDLQLQAASVEGPNDDGYFEVFVPGAWREQNFVTADNAEAAVAKVREFLVVKINQTEEPANGATNHEIDPDTLKVEMKAQVRPATEEESNSVEVIQ